MAWLTTSGPLTPGKKADIIAVPLPSRSSGDLHYDLLRETKSCMMNMVNGKIIYEKMNYLHNKLCLPCFNKLKTADSPAAGSY